MTLLVNALEVRQHLSIQKSIRLVRDAMMALAAGASRQPLREILALKRRGDLSIMLGQLDGHGFGAKIISVMHGEENRGSPSHKGVVVLFDEEQGEVAGIIHAGELTAIRTAAASAAATQTLAREDSRTLAIAGAGEQARQHIFAMTHVRPIERIFVWSRIPSRAQELVESLSARLPQRIEAKTSFEEAVASADIICTTTAAVDPLLTSSMVRAGTHINAVGSSSAHYAELSNDLVARGRFIPDYRPGVLKQGGEFLRAKAAGLVDDDHVLEGIGSVYSGRTEGRRHPDEVTIYKSIGHIVQDLACASWLLGEARLKGFGSPLKL